jgi:hypothetical protein
MANEVRADPVELARVAQTYLDNSKDLAAALRAVRADAVVAPADFGRVTSAGALNSGYAAIVGAAGTGLERLVALLEVDNEGLLRAAFAYEQADQAAERAVRRQHRNIPV